MRSIDVIIPVHNGTGLLEDCLAAVVSQLTPEDRVVVVDDGSTDDTAAVAERLGATVLRQSPAGPYAARQRAALQSSAWALVFTDTRCRPRPGWLESHRELLARPDAALSCSDVNTVAGPTLASRIAAYQQPFRLDATITGWHLPYFPTCNLGVRREAFVAVDGFPEVRSGGDAQLCWRIQAAGLGELAVDPATLVDWVPRSSLKDLAKQYWRYGRSSTTMDDETRATEEAQQAPEGRSLNTSRAGGLVRDVARGHVEPAVAAGAVALAIVRQLAIITARRT